MKRIYEVRGRIKVFGVGEPLEHVVNVLANGDARAAIAKAEKMARKEWAAPARARYWLDSVRILAEA